MSITSSFVANTYTENDPASFGADYLATFSLDAFGVEVELELTAAEFEAACEEAPAPAKISEILRHMGNTL